MPADPSLLGDTDPVELMDVEAARLDAFFASMPDAGWSVATACADWNAKDLLGHLAASEEYNHACMDDEVAALLERYGARGVTDMNSFNALGVTDRADRSPAEVLAEWRSSNGRTRAWLRAHRGQEMPTLVGPYPVDWQSWHLANELAIHADDLGVPVSPAEKDARTAWLARFARFAVSERDKPVTIEPAGEGYRIAAGGTEGTVSADDLVAGVNGRAAPDGAPTGLLAPLSMY